MADIDELSLKINVADNDSSKKIRAVATAINALKKSLDGLKDVNKQMNALNNMLSSLSKAIPTKTVQPKNNKSLFLEKVNLDDLVKSGDLIKEEKKENGDLIQTYTKVIEGKKKIIKVTNGMCTSYEDFIKKQKQTDSSFQKFSKVFPELTKGVKSFTKSIGRIALYRIIRTTLKLIAQGTKEGLENIRSVNSELNSSMNNISQSFTTLKNSLATALIPIIQSVEPIIVKISDAIGNFINKINEAKAAAAGETTYTKILTSDTEEYQKALEEANNEKERGNLLSFDSFNILNQNKSSSYKGSVQATVGMTSEEGDSLIKRLSTINEIIIAIAASIAALKLASIVSTIVKIHTGVEKLGLALKTKIFSGITLIVVGLVEAIAGVVDLVKLFKEGGTTAEWFSASLKVLAGVLTLVFGILVMTKAAKTAKTIVGVVAGVATAGAIIATAIASSQANAKNVASYATGGQYETGDYFKANENGTTEMIASTNNGGTVMNIDQWASVSYSSFYRALSDYNAAKNTNSNMNINDVGRAIASSYGFRNELNRRNTGLNLR